MDDLLQDLRFGLRLLLARPAFTAVAVLSLALGIGANSTIFSLVDALLLRTLPVAHPERLVTLYTVDEKNPGLSPSAHLNWRDLRAASRSYSGVLGYDWVPMSVTIGGGEPRVVFGQLASGNYFDLLGIRAARGRTFTADEDAPGAGRAVAVVSDRFWRQRLGADPAAVGRTVLVNHQPVTVVGVAPPEFTGTDVGVQPELWLPMALHRIVRPNRDLDWYETRRGLFVFAIGRLRPGVSLAAAQAEATGLSRRLQQEYPDDDKGRSFRLVPLAEATIPAGLRGGVVAIAGLLLTVVGLVLLVACANVANLLLARAAARRKEIAIRLSIGAGRGRLIRQLLTESVLLALLGGAGGLLFAAWATRGLAAVVAAVPFGVTTKLDLGLDPRVLLFTLGLSLLTGLVFGLVPALQASRPELVGALKSQVPPPAGGGRSLSGRNLLVAAQVAFSLVALIAAGLFLRSLGAAERTDPGFETAKLVTLNFDLGLGGYDPARGQAFLRQMIERVSAVPGVRAATVAQAGPLAGTFLRSVFLEGQDATKSGTLIQVNGVGPRYFETLGVPLVRGRSFTAGDREGAPPVVVVNETMAAKLWPGQDPIGKRFRFFGDKFLVEVVGVARNVKYNTLGEDPQPYIYLPLAQRYDGALALLARTAGDPAAVLPTVEREVRGMDKGLPITNVATVERVLANGLWAPRVGASLLAVFGLLALVLAAVGIYGVTSFSVARRAREIGIRMALGARRGTVLGMVLGQGMTVVALGLAVGIAVAAAVSRLAAGLLFGISPTDPLAFGATALLLAAVALAANLLPARRATAVDPVTALRQE